MNITMEMKFSVLTSEDTYKSMLANTKDYLFVKC